MARQNKRLVPTPQKVKELKAEIERFTARAVASKSKIIPLSADKQATYSEYIWKRVDASFQSKERKDAIERVQRYRQYFESGVPRTQTDMKGGHDYRSKMAASLSEGMRSRIISIFSQEPVIKVEGRNEKGIMNARNAELLLDYHHDMNVQLSDKGDVTTQFLTVDGHCIWYYPYKLDIDDEVTTTIDRQKFFRIKENKEEEFIWVDIYSQKELQDASSQGFSPVSPPDFDTEYIKAPVEKKNWPDLSVHGIDEYIWTPGTKPWEKPIYEGVKQAFTLGELQDMEDKGEIYKGSLEKIRVYLQRNSDAVGQGNNVDQTGVDVEDTKSPFDFNDPDTSLTVWVVWGNTAIPGEKSLKETVTFYHHESRTVLRVHENIYIQKLRPMRNLRLMRLPWRFAGVGSMELGEDGERHFNDLINYVLDETRIMSAIPFKEKIGSQSNTQNPFDFWKGIRLRNLNDWQEINIRDRRPIDLTVGTVLRANTERRIGIGDLQLGRESDISGKQPPTARGIISILREGQIRLTPLNFSLINEVVGFASDEILLFQQFMGSQMKVEVLDEDGKMLFPNGLSKRQIAGSYKLIPNANAQNLIRELDSEMNLLLYNTLKDNKLINASLESFYNMTNDVIKAVGKKKSWLPPLDVVQKALGQEQEITNLTEAEKEFVEEMKKLGVPIDKIKEELEISRGERPAPPEEPPEGDLITGQGEEPNV